MTRHVSLRRVALAVALVVSASGCTTYLAHAPDIGRNGERVTCKTTETANGARSASVSVLAPDGTATWAKKLTYCDQILERGATFGADGGLFIVDQSETTPRLRAFSPSGVERWNAAVPESTLGWELTLGGDGKLYAYAPEYAFADPQLRMFDPATGSQLSPITPAPRSGDVRSLLLVPTTDGAGLTTSVAAHYLRDGAIVASRGYDGHMGAADWGNDDSFVAAAKLNDFDTCDVRVQRIAPAGTRWSAVVQAPFDRCLGHQYDIVSLPDNGAFLIVGGEVGAWWLARLDAQGDDVTWSTTINEPFIQIRERATKPIADESGNVVMLSVASIPCETAGPVTTCQVLRVHTVSAAGDIDTIELSEPVPWNFHDVRGMTLRSGALSLAWEAEHLIDNSRRGGLKTVQLAAGSSLRDLRRWNTLTGAPIPAASPGPGRLVALGDSYSAGYGAGPYDVGSDDCQRSQYAWPRVLTNTRLDIAMAAHVACNGATITAMYESFKSEAPQLDWLDVIDDADIVTLSVGGNDIGFGVEIMAICIFIPLCNASTFAEDVRAALDNLRPDLVALYLDILSRAPTAQVRIMGYPLLFPDPAPPLTCVPGLDGAEMNWMNDMGRELNDTIREAVYEVQGSSGRMFFVDPQERFDTHDVCATDRWLNSFPPLEGAFHPNAPGYTELAELASATLGTP